MRNSICLSCQSLFPTILHEIISKSRNEWKSAVTAKISWKFSIFSQKITNRDGRFRKKSIFMIVCYTLSAHIFLLKFFPYFQRVFPKNAKQSICIHCRKACFDICSAFEKYLCLMSSIIFVKGINRNENILPF